MIQQIKKIFREQFWPIMLFKNCHQGNKNQQEKSYLYNQQHIFLLQIPILNWILISIYSYISLFLIDQYSHTILINNIIAAIFGIFFSISIINSLILSVAYMYLGHMQIESSKSY